MGVWEQKHGGRRAAGQGKAGTGRPGLLMHIYRGGRRSQVFEAILHLSASQRLRSTIHFSYLFDQTK